MGERWVTLIDLTEFHVAEEGVVHEGDAVCHNCGHVVRYSPLAAQWWHVKTGEVQCNIRYETGHDAARPFLAERSHDYIIAFNECTNPGAGLRFRHYKRLEQPA